MHELDQRISQTEPNAEESNFLPNVNRIIVVNPHERYAESLAAIDHRYSRHFDADPSALDRPNWLRTMATAFAEIEFQRRTQELFPGTEKVDPASWAQDKFRVMTEYLKIHSPDEVRQLDAIIQSFTHFRGYGYNKKTSAELFSNDVAELIVDNVVDVESVASWFDAVGGFASSNPALMPTLLSTGRELNPMAGWGRLQLKGLLEPMDYEIAEEELIEMLEKKNSKLTQIEGEGALTNIRDFSHGVADNMRRMDLPGELQVGLNKIADKALGLAGYIDELDVTKKPIMDISRPTPPDNIFVQVATALSEHLVEQGIVAEPSEVRTIAERLLGTLRRSRIALTRGSLMTFFAGFREESRLNIDLLPRMARPKAGKALSSIDKLADSDKAGAIKSEISNKIIPELVLQARISGLSTFRWKQSDYEALGFEKRVWRRHADVVERVSERKVNGPSAVRSGSILLDYFGQFQPTHVGHTELIREAVNLKSEDFRKCGLIQQGERANGVLVGISVNRGNPSKANTESPYKDRRDMVIESTRGLRGVFFWPEDEIQGPTLQKLILHMSSLTTRGKRPLRQIRLSGTDSSLKRYVQDKEGQQSKSLIQMYHLFALQAEELRDPWTMISSLKDIYERFPSTIVIVGSVPEVHSSYFRDRILEMDDATLSTLVHPGIIEKLRERKIE